MKDRPLVVLAGWLGSQRRQLRRYEQLYERLGFQVVSEIATPSMVVGSCFHQPPVNLPPLPWPSPLSSPKSATTMQELAWNVLRDIHHSRCDWFVFHAFSNGGCLLWEEVRRALGIVDGPPSTLTGYSQDTFSNKNDNDNDNDNEIVMQTLASLRGRTRGLVLDSCPGRHLEYVGRVLPYCSWLERIQVIRDHGFQVSLDPASTMPEQLRQRGVHRAQAYWQSIATDPWHLPQLYLYSVSDPLIPYQDLDELFEIQQHRLGNDRAYRCRFEKSRHCAHLLDNPSEYESAIASFVETFRTNSQGETTESKL